MNRWVVFALFVLGLTALVGVLFFTTVAVLSHYEARQIKNCVNLVGQKTCHSKDESPYRYYGTKTAYHVALPALNESAFHFPDCVPQVFYMMARHASRYPDKDDIEESQIALPLLKDEIIKAAQENKSGICAEDINKLKTWKFTFHPDDDNKISESGKQEAFDLAQRYKNRFPTILSRDFSPNDFVFEFTGRERTMTSAMAFAKGLFGSDRSIHFYGQTNDKVLQFHKDCKAAQKKCKNEDDYLEEIEKFAKGPFIRDLVYSITKRLGFRVTYEDVKLMYEMCQFGFGITENDNWCSVFSHDELKVLEYEDDIDDYYKDSYGDPLNYQQACPVVDYIVRLLNSSISQPKKKAVMQFSHAGAIKKVFARLGLFEDDNPMTASNLCSQDNRKWRSSLIAPFNANIVIVLYQCQNKSKIAAFHNEVPVILGGCEAELCPIEDFMSKYGNISRSCNVNSMCCTCCVE